MAVTQGLIDEVLIDPLVRGYAGMTDAEVIVDLYLVIREGPADQGALFNYLAKETSREDPAEGVATAIYGRLRRVDELGTVAIGTPVFHAANLADEELDACRTLLAIATQDRLESLAQVMTEAKLVALLELVKDAGVMKQADIDAIGGLSQNKQHRVSELQLVNPREGDIARVRA